MAKKREEQFTAAEPGEAPALIGTPPAPPPGEFHGMGGSYTVDPVTGQRTRVAHTREVPVIIDPKTNARIPRDPEA